MTQYLGNALIEVIALVNGQSFQVPPLTSACKESLGIDGERRALQEANGPSLPIFQVFANDGTQIIDIDGNSDNDSDSNSDETGSSGGTHAPTPTPRKPMYETVDEIDVVVKDTEGKIDGIQDVLTPMQEEVNNIKEQVQEIHEINALMHEILNRTLAPTLSPSQSPCRSVRCKVVPFVFHTQYIPHLTTCYLFLCIHILRS